MEKGFYLVGGAVRDSLLGLSPKDHDYLAVGYTVEEMVNLGYKQVGADFPVFLHPKTGDEYALPRKERSTGSGYNDFIVETKNVSVEEDLMRRDLTINAMALAPNGELIDPYGGSQDLKNKILRHVSEAFKEDPLRVLRIARFRARFPEFKIHEETVSFILEMKEMLNSLNKERVFKELEKALSEKAPYMFFITLNELGVLDIVFPELYAMTKVMHTNRYHMEGTVFNHSMLVLKAASELTDSPLVRFGALYHDIGKVPSYEKYGDFYQHYELELVDHELDILKNRYRLPNKYKKIARQAALLHHTFQGINNMKAKTIVKHFTKSYFPKEEKELREVLIACEADNFGRLILVDGPLKYLDIYESLSAVDYPRYTKGERQYKSGKYERPDFIDKEKIVSIFKAIKSVHMRDFDTKQANVQEIKQELYMRRIRAVKSILRSYK